MEKKVLLVDDEQLILKSLAQLFQSHGYCTCCSLDGEEALEIMQRENVRVGFLDLRMPDMDGMELCWRIKELDPGAVVYALSGYVDAFDREDFRDAGFDGRFRKPFRIDVLLEACHGAFDHFGNKMEMYDRRHHQRFELAENVFITTLDCETNPDLVGMQWDCHTQDVTEAGLQIWTDTNLPVGTILVLRIDMSEHARTFLLQGEIRWVAEREPKKLFKMGIRLLCESQDMESWRDFMDETMACA